MAKHIPFLFNSESLDLADEFYGDSDLVRVALPSLEKTPVKDLPENSKVWLDTGFEGFHWWGQHTSGWFENYQGFPHADTIGTTTFQANSKQADVQAFVSKLLDKCNESKPHWLTVPLFPIVEGSSRKKVCRHLAKATATWAEKAKYKGKLILPLVITHQNQVNKAAARNNIISLAKQCYKAANADGFWVVDSSLDDSSGSKTLVDTRFGAILALHEKLKADLPKGALAVGGPYWALNLVLWSRGLITHPAIGVGGRFRYSVPGRKGGNPPKRRVALTQLRRCAVASSQLNAWFKHLPADPAYDELHALARDSQAKGSLKGARRQVARFYKDWFDGLAKAPEAGRALALFQDFSSAYVLGKPLERLPADEGTARRPERVAEQFMLFSMSSS